MKVIPACHDRNKCALQGPFSPFTFALQDIRSKLITRRDHHEAGSYEKGGGFTQVDREYLRHIISICIPLYNSKDLTEAYITFPIAACYRDGSEELLLYYSGKYDDSPAQATEGLEQNELKEVQKVIENYIISTKDDPDGPTYVKLEDIIKESSTIPTQYPQSLRTIQGFFKATSNDRKFYVFLSCQPAGEGCTLSASCNKDCWKTTITAFCKSFMSSDVRCYLDKTLDNVKKIKSRSKTGGKSYNAHKPDTSGAYNLLKDILSNIQADAVKLIRLPDNKASQRRDDFQERKRRAFSVVFVLPYLASDRQLNFRYVLTHEQTQILKNLSKSERLEELIENMEKDSFESLFESLFEPLMGEVENSIGEKLQIKREEFSPKLNFRALVERLRKNVTFDASKNVVIDENGLSGQVEEHLRTAILLDYAFQGPTKDEVLSVPHLAAYMDSVNIEYGQAFLLDQIFRARRPDVMISMVNHPLSKLQQCRTHDLMDAYQEKSTNKSLYPAGLHLLETLLLHPPLFMYPIYQHEAPILLCAFDAALYSGSWQALKSMVDAHTEGIFSAIVSHELDESKRFFNKSDNITSMSIPGAMDELAERLTYLLLRFCPSLYYLNKDLEKEEKVLEVLDHAMTGECVAKINYEWDPASILIPDFAKKVTVPLNLITRSEAGRRLLQYYVELCVNSFLGVWKVAELSRSEEAEQWAHAINGELQALSPILEIFKSKLPNAQKLDFELYERRLAILQSNVHALQNINRLKNERTSIFTGDTDRTKLSQAIIESFLLALLRLFSDADVYYTSSREQLIKGDLLFDEPPRTLKDMVTFLKYFNNAGQLNLDGMDEIVRKYFKDDFHFRINKCSFANQLLIKTGIYESLLKFVFMEMFFNGFKYLSYDEPRIEILINGELFGSQYNDYLSRRRPEDQATLKDQATLITFSNSAGHQEGGSMIGESFLLSVANIAVSDFSRRDMLPSVEDGFSINFPVLVWRSDK